MTWVIDRLKGHWRSLKPPTCMIGCIFALLVLMRWWGQNHRRNLDRMFVKLYLSDRLTLADPAAWWKFTSLCLVGLCRPPCGALQATCFIQLRPLRTTTSPVMVLMFRPAGITRAYGSICGHTCRMKHDYIPHVGRGTGRGHPTVLTKVQH